MPTEIKVCNNCRKNNITHDFQDQKYGKFVRVFNLKDAGKGSTCTVCNNGLPIKK